MLFIRKAIYRFFRNKARKYTAAGVVLMEYPPNTFLYTRGQLCLAVGELYSELASSVGYKE